MQVERAEAINKADVRIAFLVVVELPAERLEFWVFHCQVNDARMSRLRYHSNCPDWPLKHDVSLLDFQAGEDVSVGACSDARRGHGDFRPPPRSAVEAP